MASQITWVKSLAQGVVYVFGGSSGWYGVMYFLLVVLFTFFYTDVLFSQQNYGENLKRSGAQIPGVTAGGPTQRYLTKVMRRITLPGALFLGVVGIVPFIAEHVTGVQSIQLSSMGLIIVVGVVLDTMKQIEAQLIMRRYEGFIK